MDTDTTVIEALRSQIREFESFEGPLYGLAASWAGRRILDGVEHATVRLHGHDIDQHSVSYNLGHTKGEHGSETFYVAVTTTSKSYDDEDLLWHLIVRGESERRPSHEANLLERFQADPAQPQTRVKSARIGADEVTFEVLSRGNCFSAKAMVGYVTVVVVGRGVDFEDVTLQPIDDLRPYIEGVRQVAQEHGFSL